MSKAEREWEDLPDHIAVCDECGRYTDVIYADYGEGGLFLCRQCC